MCNIVAFIYCKKKEGDLQGYEGNVVSLSRNYFMNPLKTNHTDET